MKSIAGSYKILVVYMCAKCNLLAVYHRQRATHTIEFELLFLSNFLLSGKKSCIMRFVTDTRVI